jgi:hypothetical protein
MLVRCIATFGALADAFFAQSFLLASELLGFLMLRHFSARCAAGLSLVTATPLLTVSSLSWRASTNVSGAALVGSGCCPHGSLALALPFETLERR